MAVLICARSTGTSVTALIPLRDRAGSVIAHAIVDAEREDWVNQWRWSLDSAGYAHRSTVRLHRELLGLKRGDGLKTDHRNRNKLDNRMTNLRVATTALNSQNRGGWGASKHRGVCWHRGRWVAQATVNYKHHHLGRFASEDEAAAVAAAFRREHMPFATG